MQMRGCGETPFFSFSSITRLLVWNKAHHPRAHSYMPPTQQTQFCIPGNVYICLLLSLHLLCLCLLICLFSVYVLSACFSSPGTMLIKAHTTGNE